jgi:hypothetical protein
MLTQDEKKDTQTLTLSSKKTGTRKITVGADAVVGVFNPDDIRAAAEVGGGTVAFGDQNYGQIATIKGGKANFKDNTLRTQLASINTTSVVAVALDPTVPAKVKEAQKKVNDTLAEARKSDDTSVQAALKEYDNSIAAVKLAQDALKQGYTDLSIARDQVSVIRAQSIIKSQTGKVAEAMGPVKKATTALVGVLGEKFPGFKEAVATTTDFEEKILDARKKVKLPSDIKLAPTKIETIEKVFPEDFKPVLEVAMMGVNPRDVFNAMDKNAFAMLGEMANANSKPKAPAAVAGATPDDTVRSV